MMPGPRRFAWYELRTTDPAAAPGFYAEVLGLEVRAGQGEVELWAAGQPVASVTRLPEQAAQRGAPAHWLGHVAVAEVWALARQIVALGGETLGPARRGAGGVERVVLRDPFGSVLALESRREPVSSAVAWHQLHTRDRERAWSLYAELFGWCATGTLELGGEAGRTTTFAWQEGERSAGGVVGSATVPQVHPHWLFYFAVRGLEDALARVRAGGGEVGGHDSLPGGDRVAYCEDPQGAAFGLYARA